MSRLKTSGPYGRMTCFAVMVSSVGSWEVFCGLQYVLASGSQ